MVESIGFRCLTAFEVYLVNELEDIGKVTRANGIAIRKNFLKRWAGSFGI